MLPLDLRQRARGIGIGPVGSVRRLRMAGCRLRGGVCSLDPRFAGECRPTGGFGIWFVLFGIRSMDAEVGGERVSAKPGW